jgi:pimeloyl-ACP methyl ester carboxylesterase
LLKVLTYLGLALLLAALGVFGIDRWFLKDACPDCHTEDTRALPLFDGSQTDGLVRIKAENGLVYRARLAGMGNKGDPIVLLHGFPETSAMWQPVLERLAKAGHRVVAFDQRGYSPDARPGSVAAYSMDRLAEDVVAVADAVGFDKFHLAGHDLGGLVGWFAADRYADRIASWTAISIPHPKAYIQSLGLGEDQLRRSAYILFLKLPWLADLVLGFNRSAYLQRDRWKYVPPAIRDDYERVFGEAGALAAAIKWYRAFGVLTAEGMDKVSPPTLFIWGNRDARIGRAGAEKTADFVEGPFRIVKLGAEHALVTDKPDLVAGEIASHAAKWKIAAPPATAFDKALPEVARKCVSAKPPCLRLEVAPGGNWINIENRCAQRVKGAVRVSCGSWDDDAYMDYRFDLAKDGSMFHGTRGLVYGSCYYKQKVCLIE